MEMFCNAGEVEIIAILISILQIVFLLKGVDWLRYTEAVNNSATLHTRKGQRLLQPVEELLHNPKGKHGYLALVFTTNNWIALLFVITFKDS